MFARTGSLRSVARDAAVVASLASAACGGSGGSDGGGPGNPALTVQVCSSTLAPVQSVEPARAAHGRALLQSETLAPGLLPEFVVRNLWVAWGTPAPAADGEYWAAFRARYGLLEAPFDNGGLPLGLRREPGGLAFDCLVCHAGRVAGTTLLGAPNSGLDLESFYDDLLVMRDLAPMFGFAQPPVPYDLDGFTSSAGAHDAFGIGFRIVGAPGLNTDFGPQRPPAWWLLRSKTRMYVDGSADASSHRATMATLVAFGIGPDELAARDPDFVDLAHFVRSIDVPCWDLGDLDAERAARGRAIFDATCASCHGRHTGLDASYPNRVVPRAEVGTDPVRAERFGEAEAAALNVSWFGNPPLAATGGYLAQPLTGIWARAPYFHNGSVPDLLGVLDPAERPARFRRRGTERDDYDTARVGFRYELVTTPPDPNTREGRLVHDTSRPGMSNAGHAYGASLTQGERQDLLEFLKSL